jgi:hypothetical protein
MQRRISELYGRFLAGLALAGCAVLLLMMLVICADVLLRNVRIVPGMLGVPWANEATEYALLPDHHAHKRPGCCARGSTSASTSCYASSPPRLAWYSRMARGPESRSPAAS